MSGGEKNFEIMIRLQKLESDNLLEFYTLENIKSVFEYLNLKSVT